MEEGMRISELINVLRGVLAVTGDIMVVSGVDRSGYAEPVVSVESETVAAFNSDTGAFDGEKVMVLDLRLSDSCLGMKA